MISAGENKPLNLEELYKIQSGDGVLSLPVEDYAKEYESISEKLEAKLIDAAGDELVKDFMRVRIKLQDYHEQRAYTQGFKDCLSLVVKNL